jgi:hypothetical protein
LEAQDGSKCDEASTGVGRLNADGNFVFIDDGVINY